jgi:hypothetical protein
VNCDENHKNKEKQTIKKLLTCSLYYAQNATQHIVWRLKMKKPMFAVFDNVAKLYMQPFLETTDGTAVRAIQDAAKGDHPFAKHPADFTLTRLGMYDEETGTLNQDSKADIIELKTLVGE